MNNSELNIEFIKSMRGITSSVYVISSQELGIKHAMTASSVTSLSLDPASMLICVNKNASIHSLLGKGKNFCINVLSPHQIELANLCSSSKDGGERFSSELWSQDEEIPFNKESTSNIFCTCFDLFEHSSHTVFFGKVTKVINNNSHGSLMYRDGSYKS